MPNEWVHATNFGAAMKYTCGFCGHLIGADKGYAKSHAANEYQERIAICPNCLRPTYIPDPGVQIPGVSFGSDVEHLPVGVKELYDEARKCFSVGGYTSVVLACRKLLMHIGVEQGAKENENFITYVEHLAQAGYVPPNGKAWVDVIRKKGNEANHEIRLMNQDDAKLLLSFLEMLLKFIYEFPQKVPAPVKP